MRTLAALFAMVAILAACGPDGETTATAGEGDSIDSAQTEDGDGGSVDSDDDGNEDGTENAGAEDEESTPPDDEPGGETTEEDTEAMEDGDSTTGDDPNDDAEELFGDSLLIGDFLLNLFSQQGIELGDEVIDCVADTGVDIDVSVLDATEDELALASAALFGCAPEQMAIVLAAETDPPPGTDSDDVICVMTETFRYIGTLPPEETLAAMDADEMPANIRSAVEDVATDLCDLDGDAVSAIFDS